MQTFDVLRRHLFADNLFVFEWASVSILPLFDNGRDLPEERAGRRLRPALLPANAAVRGLSKSDALAGCSTRDLSEEKSQA